MIKKELVFFLAFIFVLAISFVSATSTCDLDAELVNQDPYPAIPGDTVEVVFQLSGVENSECEGAFFEVVLSYPFSLEGGESPQRVLSGGTYTKNYRKEWIIPYNLVVSENAVDGDRELEVRYRPGSSRNEETYFSEEFNISVEEVRVDFELSIRDYDNVNNEITFEILNIGENDIEALTIDVPEQENLIIRGSPRTIVGSLDSNEEETFRIKAEPSRGMINLAVTYTDKINERRMLEKSVFFEPDYFEVHTQGGISPLVYILIIAAGVGIFFWIRKKKRRERIKKEQKHK